MISDEQANNQDNKSSVCELFPPDDTIKVTWDCRWTLKTTRWVMQRGILGQFRGVRGMLYDPPTSVSPTHD
jgi:hypothetical protein